MPASQKPQIIERIFNTLWDSNANRLTREIVTFEDIQTAIEAHNAAHGSNVSRANPANFFKDYTRSVTRANSNWPNTVFARGYAATQVTGNRRSFQFVPIAPGQPAPFVSAVDLPSPEAPNYEISSVVVPIPVRALARSDEPSLLQLAVRLRVVETYMSLHSQKRNSVRQIDHLQNSVKLRGSEVDAIFLGTEEDRPNQYSQFLITCEAKARNEDVMMAQLVRQPLAILETMRNQDRVVPIVVRALRGSKIQVVEFREVTRAQSPTLTTLEQVGEALYQLRPTIPGFL